MRRRPRSRIEARMKTLTIEDDAETATFIAAGIGRAVSPIAGGQKQGPDVATRPLEDIIKGIEGNVISPPAQTHRTLRAAAMDTWRTASAAEISSVASHTFRNR